MPSPAEEPWTDDLLDAGVPIDLVALLVAQKAIARLGLSQAPIDPEQLSRNHPNPLLGKRKMGRTKVPLDTRTVEKIRHLTMEKEWTQKAVANELGLPMSTVARYQAEFRAVRRLSQEQLDEGIRLREQGLSWREVGKRIDGASRCVIRRDVTRARPDLKGVDKRSCQGPKEASEAECQRWLEEHGFRGPKARYRYDPNDHCLGKSQLA